MLGNPEAPAGPAGPKLPEMHGILGMPVWGQVNFVSSDSLVEPVYENPNVLAWTVSMLGYLQQGSTSEVKCPCFQAELFIEFGSLPLIEKRQKALKATASWSGHHRTHAHNLITQTLVDSCFCGVMITFGTQTTASTIGVAEWVQLTSQSVTDSMLFPFLEGPTIAAVPTVVRVTCVSH